MDSLKDRPIIANRRSSARSATPPTAKEPVLQTRLAFGDELSIMDAADFGRDPYNSTGQHCVLKSRLAADE